MIMKELSIEQKAKAYDEALERAKKWYYAPNIDKIPTYGNRIIKEIFPEFKENNNERLRKTTIAFLKDFVEQGYENAVECVNWLEKQQDEQILANSAKTCKDEQRLAWCETLEKLRLKWLLGNSLEAKYKVEVLDELIDELKKSQTMTARDVGHIDEIITHLKKVENDYHINLASEIEWLKELYYKKKGY